MGAAAGALESAGGAESGIGLANLGADTQSEESILGITADEGSGDQVIEGQEADLQTDTQTTTEKTDGQQVDEDLDAGLESAAIPTELKHLMSDPKVAPTIQRMAQQNNAYRTAFGTVRDARTFATEFPGGVKEAVDQKQKAYALDEADDAFASGDPGTQERLASEWATAYPQAFGSMVQASLKVLQSSNPQAFSQFTGQVLKDSFSANRFDEQMEAIATAIAGLSSEQIADPAIRRLAGLTQWMVEKTNALGIKYQRNGQLSPEQEALNKRTQELDQRSQQHQQSVATYATNQANGAALSSFTPALKSTLGKLLKESAFTDAGKQRIEKEIQSTISERLKADQGLQRNFAKTLKDGQFSPEATRKAAELLSLRAKALITSVAKNIIDERTKEFIAHNQSVNDKKVNAGKRADITGGQAPATRSRTVPREQIGRMTDADQQALVDAHFGG